MIDSASIVGLGEPVHGSKEFFQIRHFLVRHLIENLGFNGLIVEMPREEALMLHYYIKTGNGKPHQLISKLSYWTLRTREFLEVIVWMRKFHLRFPERRISFRGCDVPIRDKRRNSINDREKGMAFNILDFLQKNRHNSKFVLWAHNAHLAYLDIPQFISMATHLKRMLGASIVNFGGLFNHGGFTAIDKNGRIKKYYLKSRNKNFYAYYFSHTCYPTGIFDIRDMRSNILFNGWTEGNLKVIEVGAMFNLGKEKEHTYNIDLPNKFDGIIWINKISPSVVLN